MQEPRPEGLRARKRQEVRTRISDTATRLFKKRGFDAVSVEEVAREADVSKATVFNYFECKEDLLLDRAPELIERVRGALKSARSTEALPALREALLNLVITRDALSGTIPAVKWFWPLVTSTPSLRARAQQHGEEFQAELARLLKAAGLGKDAALVAAMVVAAWWCAWKQAVEEVQAERTISRVRATQRATLERAFAALIGAFPGPPRRVRTDARD
jgi:AcrR family transcriptional regulator